MKILTVIDYLHHKTLRVSAEDISSPSPEHGSWVLLKVEGKPRVGSVIFGVRDVPSGTCSENTVYDRLLSTTEVESFLALQQGARSRIEKMQDLADNLKLKMHIFASRIGWKKSTVSFFFVAPSQVDFRELLRVSAQKFDMRIHFQWCGPRDRAKIVGGYGVCGRGEDCCTFNNINKEKVPMDAVRDQGLRIKGNNSLFDVSGKLKECMLYEVSMYRSNRKYLPHIQQKVTTNNQVGKVIGLDILHLQVKMEFENGTIGTFPVSQVEYPNKQIAPEEPELKIPEASLDIEGVGITQ